MIDTAVCTGTYDILFINRDFTQSTLNGQYLVKSRHFHNIIYCIIYVYHFNVLVDDIRPLAQLQQDTQPRTGNVFQLFHIYYDLFGSRSYAVHYRMQFFFNLGGVVSVYPARYIKRNVAVYCFKSHFTYSICFRSFTLQD